MFQVPGRAAPVLPEAVSRRKGCQTAGSLPEKRAARPEGKDEFMERRKARVEGIDSYAQAAAPTSVGVERSESAFDQRYLKAPLCRLPNSYKKRRPAPGAKAYGTRLNSLCKS